MGSVPNADRAQIAARKLSGYLLDLQHPDGGGKARFLAQFGFTADNAMLLRAALLAHLRDHGVIAIETNAFGTIYEVEGAIASPDGRNPLVRVVWMIDNGQDAPRLITLVPGRRP